MLGRRGLYLKHASVALDLARSSAIVFDKTGTLTSTAGAHRADPVGLTSDEWRLARRLASESVHPVSRVMSAWGPADGEVRDAHEVPGGGLRGVVDGRRVVLGSPAFVARDVGAGLPHGVEGPAVAIDGAIRGWVRLLTPVRPGVEDAVRALAVTHDVSLMSGDRAEEAARWRPVFGARMAFAQSPAGKLAAIEARQARGERILMIGDGLNDAGALAAAAVGMAVSDETACIVPACDAVIRGDRLAQLPALLRFTRRARQVVIACFALSIVYNAVGLSLALSGLLTPLVTAILMPVSSLTILALGSGGMRWYARELTSAAARAGHDDALDRAVAAGASA
jgi:Cu+-exporting ATPase